MYALVWKLYRHSKVATKTAHFQKKPQGISLWFLSKLEDFDQSQNSKLNTLLESPSQELLNVYFSFEI